jgi:hypothetical protein
MPVTYEPLPHDELAAAWTALSIVAARAMGARQTLSKDWGRWQEAVEIWCRAELDSALDELEMCAPALHARLAQEHELVEGRLRRELGPPPA